MLKYFQHIRPSAIVALFIGLLLLRLPAFWFYKTHAYNASGMMNQFFAELNNQAVLSMGLAFVFVFVQALLFNRLCIDHDVLYTHSFMPAWMFVLCNSIFPEMLFFNPVLIGNFLVLGALSFVLGFYRANDGSLVLFYTAALFSLSSFFIVEYITAPILLVVFTIIFKNVKIRDLLAIVSGALVPYIFIGAGSWMLNIPFQLPSPTYNLAISNLKGDIFHFIAVLAFLLLVFLGLTKTSINYFKNNIQTRRVSLLFISFLVYTILILAFRFNQIDQSLHIAAPALSMFSGYFLLGNKGKNSKEFLHFVLLTTIVVSLYLQFLKPLFW
jgi:hypothetical protein